MKNSEHRTRRRSAGKKKDGGKKKKMEIPLVCTQQTAARESSVDERE